MNILTGTLHWNKFSSLKKNSEENFSNGFLDLHVDRIHCFKSHGKNYFHNSQNNNVCVILGYISNIREIKSKYLIESENDVEIVEKLYSTKGLDFISFLEGSFIVFIWNGKTNKGYILLDHFGSSLPVYYVFNKEKLIFSTSLKEILKRMPFKRELNIPVVYDFLSYVKYSGPSPTNSTLIKHVNKLIIGQYLHINYSKKSIKIKNFKKKEKKVSIESAKKNVMKSIQQNIERIAKELRSKNVNHLLSSGCDSNLTLYYLSILKDIKVTALTIGGKKQDETRNTKLLTKSYKNIKHKIEFMDSKELNDLPDVIWRLEGAIQSPYGSLYNLFAKKIKKNTKVVFSGMSAEFLFSTEKSSEIIWFKKNLIDELYYFRNVLFKKGLFKGLRISRISLLKKYIKNDLLKILFYNHLQYLGSIRQGLIFNSFNVQDILPIFNERTKVFAKPLRKLNFNRAYYEKEVKTILGKNRAQHIQKLPIPIDIEFMFENKWDAIIKFIESDFVKNILSRDYINTMMKNPKQHLWVIFCLLYIHVFNELFVSGKFDSKFDKIDFDNKLEYFLK